MVVRALRHFDEDRYRLYAWCVMPNHVHVVAAIPGELSLASILHSWKSFSANNANKLLGRTGAFWQREYFDHLIRSQRSFERCVHYLLSNPAKAHLADWSWVWSRENWSMEVADGRLEAGPTLIEDVSDCRLEPGTTLIEDVADCRLEAGTTMAGTTAND